MKRVVSFLLSAIILSTCCVFQANAINEENFIPYIIDLSLTSPIYENANESTESRATGLIMSYGLEISATGTTIRILGETYCAGSVVKSGFKNFVVQRKKVTSSTWSDYYDYGDLYSDTYAASVNTTLAVESGYQYRVTCKHYAKKSLLVTQSISNTSNVVSV